MSQLLAVLFDGFAYGMLLFLLSVGLSVTLGMMNFTNLAHGAFAMVGGYVTWALVEWYGWPFLATLPMAFLVTAAIAAVFEALLFRRLYDKGELNQVLFTIGLVFTASSIAPVPPAPVARCRPTGPRPSARAERSAPPGRPSGPRRRCR
jgi:branched-chain amino acid transport system permease protein